MDLEQEIKNVKQQLNSLERIQTHVYTLNQKRKKLEKLQANLQLKVEKEFEEYQDIKQRNEQAIRNLFLLPDEEKLEKEKQEYFEAVLDLRKVDKEIELVQFESNILSEKLRQKNELQNSLMDLIKMRAAQKVQKLRENVSFKALEQKIEMQDAIIYLIDGIKSKAQDNKVRIDETLASLHQIELYGGLRKKVTKSTTRRILSELGKIENHLARLQVNFAMLESECIAYNKLVKEDRKKVPDWEKHLAPMRQFSENFHLKADLKLLKKGFIQSKKWLIQLKFHVENLIKESAFLIEEHDQLKRQAESAKADLLKE